MLAVSRASGCRVSHLGPWQAHAALLSRPIHSALNFETFRNPKPLGGLAGLRLHFLRGWGGRRAGFVWAHFLGLILRICSMCSKGCHSLLRRRVSDLNQCGLQSDYCLCFSSVADEAIYAVLSAKLYTDVPRPAGGTAGKRSRVLSTGRLRVEDCTGTR